MCNSIIIMNSNTFNPLATILNQNKLMESNFMDWKRTLDIILIASGCRYVLTIPPLPEPELHAPQYERTFTPNGQKTMR